MKKTTLLSISFVFCATCTAFSQSTANQTNKFSLGIIGGANIATMHFPNSQEPDDQRITSLLGFGAGAVVDFNFSTHIKVRLEPMYLQKGGKIEEGADPANQPEGLIKSSSVEIPILVHYTFGNIIQPYLVAGPSIGYNLKSEISFDLTGLDFVGDMSETTTKIDLGLAFGGGIQIPIKIVKIFLEAKYTYGLMNQRENGTVTLTSGSYQFDLDVNKDDDKFTNRGLQIMLGIVMPL